MGSNLHRDINTPVRPLREHSIPSISDNILIFRTIQPCEQHVGPVIDCRTSGHKEDRLRNVLASVSCERGSPISWGCAAQPLLVPEAVDAVSSLKLPVICWCWFAAFYSMRPECT
ncbi:hypothetical protein TWF481_011500 [Arthrobotrys musiformis]|uniref:Uncharacterized protein n=1 Tax=Arthrobotrys musiformis TaxID=47236 RepID=A0AAV9VYQ6_9PEZI